MLFLCRSHGDQVRGLHADDALAVPGRGGQRRVSHPGLRGRQQQWDEAGAAAKEEWGRPGVSKEEGHKQQEVLKEWAGEKHQQKWKDGR